MIFLYEIGLYIFYAGLCIASLFNSKARKWVKGRCGVFRQLKQRIAANDKVMWMHCSSLGEFEQGRPLLEAFRSMNPEYKIVLTFFSPSGYEQRKNYEHADCVAYIPLDTWINAHRFMSAVHPDITFFVKYDFWYNHLRQARRKGGRLYLISSVFRQGQAFFKWYGHFFRSMLRMFTRIFVQNEESLRLLQGIGICDVMVAGDTRFDRVRQIAANSKTYPLVEQFINSKPCLVAGSTWEKDEELIAEAAAVIPQVKLIIVPHEVHEANIEAVMRRFSFVRCVRYTQAVGKNMDEYDVLIIDTIGMLSSLYRYGQVAYTGGGFVDGIHNILEAAVFGIPVVFGSNYSKFIEAVDLVSLGGAVSINNAGELKGTLKEWFNNEPLRSKYGDICCDYIERKQGTTKMILQNIL